MARFYSTPSSTPLEFKVTPSTGVNPSAKKPEKQAAQNNKPCPSGYEKDMNGNCIKKQEKQKDSTTDGEDTESRWNPDTIENHFGSDSSYNSQGAYDNVDTSDGHDGSGMGGGSSYDDNSGY